MGLEWRSVVTVEDIRGEEEVDVDGTKAIRKGKLRSDLEGLAE